MRRLVIAALVAVSVCVVAATAMAASGNGASVIYDSTTPNGSPTNQVSLGPEAYGFRTIGDEITFAGAARSLSNVTVTLSSWACQQGSWYGENCFTQPGATFSQPITLTIWDKDGRNQLAASTQTFDVPYRPSASPKCTGDYAGRWQTPSKECKNGITDNVTFNFSHVRLPKTVLYEISYNTSNYGPSPMHVPGPYDSLNVAITYERPSVGDTAEGMLQDGMPGAPGSEFDTGTPAVQFKAGNAS